MATVTSPAKKRKEDQQPAPTLRNSLVRDVLRGVRGDAPRKRLLTFDHNDTVGRALRSLARNNILSAPVVLAPSLEDSSAGAYLGMIDTSDLLKHIIVAVAQEAEHKEGKERWKALEEAGAKYLETKLIVICGEDTEFAFPGYHDKTVHEIIEEGFFRDPTHPVHRVTISDLHGRLSDIISQSDVVRFLHENAATCLGDLRAKTIADLGLVQGHSVVTVNENVPAIEALHKMYETKVSSLGIVNEEGKLVGNLSASDLRGMDATDFPLLTYPVLRFLFIEKFKREEAESKAHPEAAKAKAQEEKQAESDEHADKKAKTTEGGGSKDDQGGEGDDDEGGAADKDKEEAKPDHWYQGTSDQLVTVSQTHTLEDVVSTLVKARKHRVYVVDENRVPLGIITLTDILKLAKDL